MGAGKVGVELLAKWLCRKNASRVRENRRKNGKARGAELKKFFR
jgi:hypothetical protein